MGVQVALSKGGVMNTDVGGTLNSERHIDSRDL